MDLVQQSFGITAVFALLGLLLWWLKRGGSVTMRSPFHGAPVRELEVLERLSLTAHHSVQLIRVKERTLLIGISPGGLHLIHDSTGPQLSIPKDVAR